MFDELGTSISEKWESFLSWCDDKGLPIRQYSDALEERGIPPGPFALGLLAVLLIAIGLVIFANMPAPSATISLSVTDDAGNSIAGANVYLDSLDGTGASFTNDTDGNGTAILTGVPLGKYNLSVSALTYNSNYEEFDVFGDTKSKAVSLLASPVLNTTLTVSILGPQTAKVTVLDGGLNIIANATQPPYEFSVPRNAKYTIQAGQDGYKSNSTTINIVNQASAVASLVLAKNDAAGEVQLDVTVSLPANSTPAAGARISVQDATGYEYASYNADSNGKAMLKLWSSNSYVIITSLEGYDDNRTEITPKQNDKLAIKLSKTDPSLAYKVLCRVLDTDGIRIRTALFRTYDGDTKLKEVTGSTDVTTTIPLPDSKPYRITAYKIGYLPGATTVSSGDDCLVTLSKAEGNSGSVRVKVVDEVGNDVVSASVALASNDGPLGMPEMKTGSDGFALFDGVPLEPIYAIAYANGRQDSSEIKTITADGEPDQNGTLLTVQLLPGKGKLKIKVLDHFTRQAIAGAQVQYISDAGTGDCATLGGTCTLETTEGFGKVLVSADSYAPYTSAQVQLKPNTETEYTAEMVSNDVAASVKPTFLGVYTKDGNKVSSLEPSTTYRARYIIGSPDINYSRAVFHVRLGDYSTQVDKLDAYITGYDGGDGSVVSSGSEYSSSTIASDTGSNASSTVNDSYATSDTPELKWVEFAYQKFTGSREAYVEFRTRQAMNGTVSIGQRTAYFEKAGSVLRDPSDDTAGKTKPEVQANVVMQKAYDISFGGTCADDYCLQMWVSSSRGDFSSNYEAAVGEEFTINVKSIAPAAYELRLLSDTVASVKLVSGSSPAGIALITNETDGERLVLPMQAGNSEASITVKALRTANVATFAAEANEKGTAENDIQIAGRIIASENNQLKVAIKPTSIYALNDSKVTFTVVDSFGTTIENAHIVIGTEDDIFGQEAYSTTGTGDADNGLAGKYVIDGINPEKIGLAKYTVEAEGYSLAYGTISVNANAIIGVNPSDTISLDIESKENQTTGIDVKNLLDNEARISTYLVYDKDPKLADMTLSENEFKLAAKASKTVNLDAYIADSVLDVATATRTLVDNFTGKVVFEARAGKSKQTLTIPFSVTARYVQQPLDSLWEVPTSPVELTITLGTDNETSSNVTIDNLLSTNLLVNYQLDSKNDWMYYTPASIVLGPDTGASGQVINYEGDNTTTPQSQPSSQDIDMIARVPPAYSNTTCIMDDDGKINTNLTLVASIRGVTSKKQVPVILSVESESNCAPEGAVDITVPLRMRADFPANGKRRMNADGSIAIGFADSSQRILFNTPATISNQSGPHITIPANTVISLAPSMVNVITPNAEFDVSMPLATTYYLSTYVQEISNADGTKTYVMQSGDTITFPSGTTYPMESDTSLSGGQFDSTAFAIAKSASFADTNLPSTVQTAMVSALGTVHFKIASADEASCRINVGFGQLATFQLPVGTQQKVDATNNANNAYLGECTKVDVSLDDGTTFSLPNANRFSFSQNSTVKRNSMGFSATVPANEYLETYVCAADASQDTYEMTFPNNITFVLPKNAKVSGNKAKFATCESVLIGTTGSISELPNALSMQFDGDVGVETLADGNQAINVPPDSKITVATCPCEPGSTDKVTIKKGITAPGGQALTTSPTSLAFNLTDGQLSQEQTICVKNGASQSLNVTPSAANPGTGYEDLANLGIIRDTDMYFSGEATHSNIVSKGDGCANMSITANVPESEKAGTCIKPGTNENFHGLITFKVLTLDGQVVSGTLPKIDTTVKITAGNCTDAGIARAALALNDVFVDYDSAITDVRTGQPMRFGFKDTGASHVRWLSVVNNHDYPVTVALEHSSNILDCTLPIPARIDAGEATTISCIPTVGSTSGNNDKIKLTFTNTDNKYTKTIYVNAVVYKPDSSAAGLYTSSPMGDMLPLGDTSGTGSLAPAGAAGSTKQSASFAKKGKSVSFDPAVGAVVGNANDTPAPVGAAASGTYGVTTFTDCTTHFCTYEQAKEAYISYANSLKAIIDYVGESDSTLNDRLGGLCNQFAGKPFKKSMVLHIANTNESLAFLNSEAADAGFDVSTASADGSAFSGCGIYQVSTAFDICKDANYASASEFKSSAKLDLEIITMQSCPVSLANAALLLGNDPEVVTGNDLTQNIGAEFWGQLAKIPTGKISEIQRVRIGTYKDNSNSVDLSTSSAFTKAIYGVSLNNSGNRLRASNLYNDGAYCTSKSGVVSAFATGIPAGLDIALGAFGYGNAWLALIQGIGGCVSSTAIKASDVGAACALTCECPMNFIAAQANLIAPGIGKMGMGEALTNVGLEVVGGGVGFGVAKLSGGSSSTVAGATALGMGAGVSYNALFNDRARLYRTLMAKGIGRQEASLLAEQVVSGSITKGLEGAIVNKLAFTTAFKTKLSSYVDSLATKKINLMDDTEVKAFLDTMTAGSDDQNNYRILINELTHSPEAKGAGQLIMTKAEIDAGKFVVKSTSTIADADQALLSYFTKTKTNFKSMDEVITYFSDPSRINSPEARSILALGDEMTRKGVDLSTMQMHLAVTTPQTQPQFLASQWGTQVNPATNRPWMEGADTITVRSSGTSEASDIVKKIAMGRNYGNAMLEAEYKTWGAAIAGDDKLIAKLTKYGYTGGKDAGKAEAFLKGLNPAEGDELDIVLRDADLIPKGKSALVMLKAAGPEAEKIAGENVLERLAPDAEALSKAKGNLARIGVSTALMMGVLLGTDCDVRPTQALVNPDVQNRLVFFSSQTGSDPSTNRLCVSQTVLTGAAGEKADADPGTCMDITSVCPDSKKMCFGLAQTPDPTGAGLPSFTLLAGSGGETTDTALKAYESIIDSVKPPAAKTVTDKMQRPTTKQAIFDFTAS